MADRMQNISFSRSINGGEKTSHVLNGNQEEVLTSLMAKLRTTSQQIKTWSDTSRKLRTVMAKCQEPASLEADRLQQCLDQLKLAIKGSMSLPAMVERLKTHAKQAGLKFHTSQNSREVFISSDVFFVEVILETSGAVEEVKICDQDESVSCPEMRDCLRQSNFKGFLDHLKGLHNFYQLSCELSVKKDAFKCLQTLEEDLKKVFKISCLSTTNVMVLILKGLAGFVTPRTGGYPMRLTFFVSPYDLLNVEKKTSTVLDMSDPLPEDMGLSLNLLLDNSQNRKLQCSSTLNVVPPTDGKKGPHYSFVPLNNSNCMNVPACFVLKLNKPMPLSIIQMKRLAINQNVTSAVPLNSLICRHAQNPRLPADNKPPTNKFYVTLPGETHCYFINESNKDMKGVMQSIIPLTCTSQAIAIVTALRQQAAYNTLIASCVRSDTCKDESEISLFEVSTVSQYKLTITFEHPAKIGMACVEMDLNDVSSVKCIIHTPQGEEPLCCNNYATKVLQKCMSIPVTMRAIMKVAYSKMDKFRKPLSTSAVPAMFSPGSVNRLSPNTGKGVTSGTPQKSTTMSYITGKIGSVRNMPTSILRDLSQSMVTLFGPSTNETPKADLKLSSDDSKVSQNPMLASLLQSTTITASLTTTTTTTKPSQNPMLMGLLRLDVPHGSPTTTTGMKTKEVKPRRKRKSTSDSRSPRQFNDDLSDDLVFFPPGLPSTMPVAHSVQPSVPTTRYPSVSDMSSIMTGGSSETKFPFTGDIMNHSMDTKHKRIESTSSQGSSNWPTLSPLTPTPWPSNRNSGTRSTLDTPENDMIMQGDIPSTPVEKTSSASIPENGTNTATPSDLHEHVPLTFFPGTSIEDDFPEIDPDVLTSEVNLLENEEGSSFDLVNMTLEPNNPTRNMFTTDMIDYKPRLDKGLLSSYPLQSSGKPSLMSRRKSSENSLTSVMDLDLQNIDVSRENKSSIEDIMAMKQPFISKGKPKIFKPDAREDSLSPVPSPQPPKKVKRKTRRKDTNSSPITVEHPKKTRRKRKLETEDEPEAKISFTMTESSEPLKFKFSRTGSEAKKQAPVTSEAKKISQLATDIKAPKITVKLPHPPAGETSEVKSSEPEPKKEPDKRIITEKKVPTTANIGEVFQTKPLMKSPSIEKKKTVSMDQTSKQIGVRCDTKQNIPKNVQNLKNTSRDTSVVNQKGLSRDVSPGQKGNDVKPLTGVKKVFTSQKPGSSLLAKKLAIQKPKIGSIKSTNSKNITQGQYKPVSVTSSNVTSKSSTPLSGDTKSTLSSGSSVQKPVSNVSKQVSLTKLVSKPPPLTVMPSQPSNVTSSRTVTTPLSGTPLSTGAAVLKKNKKTINSIVEVLQMKAQKIKGDNESSTEDMKEVQRTVTAPSPDTSTSRTPSVVSSQQLDVDKKPNVLSKSTMAVKTQKPKPGSVTPLKSPTYSNSSKPATPKTLLKGVSSGAKSSQGTSRPPSMSSPRQNKMSPSQRSILTSSPTNKVQLPTSNKIPQKISSPSKTNVQKGPSSPIKTLVKTNSSPGSSVQRKPNILSKSPKPTASPKSKVIGVTTKVVPQIPASHLGRSSVTPDGNRKPNTVVRSISNPNNSKASLSDENISKTSNSSSKVEKIITTGSISPELRKTDTQLLKKVESIHSTKQINSKSETFKGKEEMGELKEKRKQSQDERGQHPKMNPEVKLFKKELPQRKIEVNVEKNENKEVISKPSESTVTQFRIPSPAVITNSKSLSMSPKPSVVTSKPPLAGSNLKNPNVTSDQKIPNLPCQVTANNISLVKNLSMASVTSEDEPINLKKSKSSSPVCDAESDNELVIDDLSEESSTVKKDLTKKGNTSSDTQTEPGSTSPRSMIAQSPLGIVASSPLGQVASPLMLPVKSPAALSGPSTQASPCPIDDDLMDEALVSVISKDDN